ncbi:MAG: cysteine--tRNA ligase [SAR324 cluster bacterium]|nr:cysteine--tRNA ligase [SAR324 cluster bacterium]
MELKLYNTLTRAKEVFQPLEAGKAGIYTCGPTVYAEAHIGNLRSYVFPDILKKTLRRLGYGVTHVINVTDVGHLTSDEDTGEDKIEQAARESKRTAWEIAAEYTEHFFADLERLNIEMPDFTPRAAGEIPKELVERIKSLYPRYASLPGHIPEQIAIIEKLEAGGFIYTIADGVYFDTAKLPDYGKLALLDVEGLREGSRVEMGDKRHKTDFALWKFTPEGARRQMEWDSPWGRGFPGWHVECSAMSMKYLGQTFDIHTGGTDHIPVHHTNEIAQSEAAYGQPFVRYWLHGQYLVLGEDERMGKSEGNMVTLSKLMEEGFDPLAFRYLTLNTHYRQYLNFTFMALESATEALKGLRKSLMDSEVGKPTPEWPEPKIPKSGVCKEFFKELCDDLNTPKALAVLWTTFRNKSISSKVKQELADFADRILSLNLFDYRASGLEFNIFDRTAGALYYSGDTDKEIVLLAQKRIEARNQKDYPTSDKLRDDLKKLGWEMKDTKDGYFLERHLKKP